MYNNLRGCDESLLLRNELITIGYGLYSTIALAIIIGTPYEITATGYKWITIVALVMFTTQHICDIKDAAGDRLRGQRSAPIMLGDAGCR
jgi:4-hydroxybenzoate polyprenyltransferase